MEQTDIKSEFKIENGDIGTRLVVGCNYHTTWQSNKSMRFVLVEIKGSKARLQTRRTRRDFWTNVKDLIYIDTKYNNKKAKEYIDCNNKQK
jgi:hypothetical protein